MSLVFLKMLIFTILIKNLMFSTNLKQWFYRTPREYNLRNQPAGCFLKSEMITDSCVTKFSLVLIFCRTTSSLTFRAYY